VVDKIGNQLEKNVDRVNKIILIVSTAFQQPMNALQLCRRQFSHKET